MLAQLRTGCASYAEPATCIVVSLQAVALALAALLSSRGAVWLDGHCGSGPSFVGVCACCANGTGEIVGVCVSEQLVWRVEAVAFLLFAALVGASFGGWKPPTSSGGTATLIGVGALLLLSMVSFFLPNGLFSAFGGMASSGNAVFLVVQSGLVINAAYTLNKVWSRKVQEAEEQGNEQARRARAAASLVAAGVLFLISCVACAGAIRESPTTAGKVSAAAALALSLLSLLVSTLERIKHSGPFVSALVMAYSMWLCFEALAVHPQSGFRCPVWANLAVVVLTLGFTLPRFGPEGARAARNLPLVSAVAEASEGEAGVAGPADGLFRRRCALHAAAALYVAGALSPQPSTLSFTTRFAAIFVVLGLYGWSLAAPLVCEDRDFGH